eukprot:3085110-Pyramimonas_sp.AAC.1
MRAHRHIPVPLRPRLGQGPAAPQWDHAQRLRLQTRWMAIRGGRTCGALGQHAPSETENRQSRAPKT